jgi:hypothetical protein
MNNKMDLEKLADDIVKLIDKCTPEEYHEALKIVAFRRPWRPKAAFWENVLYQFLHIVYAFVVFSPVLVWPSYLTAGISGFILGMIREIEQYQRWDLHILMFWDRLQDATFFAVGSLLLYHIVK